MHDAIEGWRKRTASRRRLGRVVVQDRGHSLGSGIALESANAAEHLVENSPEAENVSAAVYGSTTHLLGRHVSRSANDGTDASKRHIGGHGSDVRVLTVEVLFDGLCQTEVEDFDAAFKIGRASCREKREI